MLFRSSTARIYHPRMYSKVQLQQVTGFLKQKKYFGVELISVCWTGIHMHDAVLGDVGRS